MSTLKINSVVQGILDETQTYVNWSKLLMAVRVVQRNKNKIMATPHKRPDPDLIAEMVEAHKQIQFIFMVWGPVIDKNMNWVKNGDY